MTRGLAIDDAIDVDARRNSAALVAALARLSLSSNYTRADNSIPSTVDLGTVSRHAPTRRCSSRARARVTSSRSCPGTFDVSIDRNDEIQRDGRSSRASIRSFSLRRDTVMQQEKLNILCKIRVTIRSDTIHRRLI